MSRTLTLSGKFTPQCKEAVNIFLGGSGPATLLQATDINGRLLFGGAIARDCKTLIETGDQWRVVDKKLGRICRVISGVGLQTSDDYGLNWTTRVSHTTLNTGESASSALVIIGCQKLDSTWHFLYAGLYDPGETFTIRHVSTTNFSSWSTPVDITVSAALRYTTFSTYPRTRLYKVGSNLVLYGSYDSGFTGSTLASTNGTTWTSTRSEVNQEAQSVQVSPSGRLYDYYPGTNNSAYTDNGTSWTTFSAPTPAGTFNQARGAFFAHNAFYTWAFNGTAFRLYKTASLTGAAFVDTNLSTTIAQNSTGLQCANGIAFAYAASTSAMRLRYVQ